MRISAIGGLDCVDTVGGTSIIPINSDGQSASVLPRGVRRAGATGETGLAVVGEIMVSRTRLVAATRIPAWTAMVAVLALLPAAAIGAPADGAAPATAPAPAPVPTPAPAPAADANAAVPAALPAAAPEVAGASATSGKPRDQQLASNWENLLHFIRMAQADTAKSFGEAILKAKPEPLEVYHLAMDKADSLAELSRARRLAGLKDIADELLRLMEEGYRSERSNPDQIKKSIELLSGNLREFVRGRDRMLVSGEYAVPFLLRSLQEPSTDMALRERIMTVLPQLGRPAVLPLAEALQTPDAQLRPIIAAALGQIEYAAALPRLKELYDRTDLQESAKKVVRAALINCNGGEEGILRKPTSQLYYDLAMKFYYRAESLAPDVRLETANVWSWDATMAGLVYKPVPREIYCDVLAVRTSRLALQHDPKFYPAVSLWLAAGLKREVDLPAGKSDPLKAGGEQAAEFYVLAAGAKYQQDILGRALRDKDWPVAVGAIKALGKTAGAESLVEPVAGGAQPLVEAMSSSSRIVRYWAAASLATALPTRRFTGSELVLPILNEAMRGQGRKTALVIAADQERRNALKDVARTAGFDVIDDSEAARGMNAARDAGGADVAILASDPDPMAGVLLIRRDPLVATMPIVVATQTERFLGLAKSDSRVRLVSPGAAAVEVSEAIAEVVKAAAGTPLTPEQATEWAVRAARAVRILGLTRSTVYDITRCRGTLANSLGDSRVEVRVAAAEALATIPGPQAQSAIAALAMDVGVDEAVRLAAFKALGENVRRYGTSIDEKMAQAMVDLVVKGTGSVKMAAAEILGALNLPSEKVKDLILTADAGKH